jgi:nicotinate-nucleotide adenylyltransferase
MPASVSPHKQHRRLTSDTARVEMLDLAVGGHAGFAVSCRELDRGGVSFTVDTLEAVQADQPAAELFFMMGADSLTDFSTWRSPERICALAIPLVVARPGSGLPDLDAFAPFVDEDRLAKIRACQVIMPHIGLSSSEIRSRVAAGKSIRYQTPRAVEKYIETHRLYRERD